MPDFLTQLKLCSIPAPVEEFRFHPTRKWRIDYCWPDYGLAIEVEGGAWTKGRHTRGGGFIKDMEKYNAIEMAGYTLLRFTPTQIRNGYALEQVKEWFEKRKEVKNLSINP